MRSLTLSVAAVCALMGGNVQAQQTEPQPAAPGIITDGSSNVTIGGMPAARAGDATDQGDKIAEGSANVFINGRPAVTMGDHTSCGGVTVGGASDVFINGKPVARSGDMTTGCADK